MKVRVEGGCERVDGRQGERPIGSKLVLMRCTGGLMMLIMIMMLVVRADLWLLWGLLLLVGVFLFLGHKVLATQWLTPVGTLYQPRGSHSRNLELDRQLELVPPHV